MSGWVLTKGAAEPVVKGEHVANSQNGWVVDTSGSLQDHSAVAGVTFPNGVRKGDVATVLLYVARRFHAEVEPLRKGECWGWFVKGIEGGTSISNHASGTAIDLNAPDHPIAHFGTFNATKVRAIRKILADCDGVVRWGGDYAGRKDEMHFEINKGAAAVEALAEKIRSVQEDDMDWNDRFVSSSWAARAGSNQPTYGNAVILAAVWAKDSITATTNALTKLLAAYTAQDHVDEQALGESIAAALAPQILAGLPEGTLTAGDVEAAVRNVLRTGTDGA